MSKNEDWKPVVDYEGLYEVSNLGRVRSLKTYNLRFFKHILAPIKNANRVMVALYKDNRSRWFCVHHLVWEAFKSRLPRYARIGFYDGDVSNCALDNLYRKDARDKLAKEFHKANYEPHAHKLTRLQVRMIRSAPKSVKNVDLARQFNVHYSTISLVRRGKRQNGKK